MVKIITGFPGGFQSRLLSLLFLALIVISSYLWVIKAVIWLATAAHSAGYSGGQS